MLDKCPSECFLSLSGTEFHIPHLLKHSDPAKRAFMDKGIGAFYTVPRYRLVGTNWRVRCAWFISLLFHLRSWHTAGSLEWERFKSVAAGRGGREWTESAEPSCTVLGPCLLGRICACRIQVEWIRDQMLLSYTEYVEGTQRVLEKLVASSRSCWSSGRAKRSVCNQRNCLQFRSSATSPNAGPNLVFLEALLASSLGRILHTVYSRANTPERRRRATGLIIIIITQLNLFLPCQWLISSIVHLHLLYMANLRNKPGTINLPEGDPEQEGQASDEVSWTASGI